MKRIKLAVVGTGGIAQAYAQVLAGMPEVEVAHVADVRRDAAQAFGAPLGATAWADHRDIPVGTADGVDGAIVCTPPATHADIAEHFLGAGVAVLCEKPLTSDTASARRIIDVARNRPALLMMAAKYRYVEDVIRAKAMIAAGTIGAVQLMENSFTGAVAMRGRWQADRSTSGGGVMIDNGTHSVDLVRYLLGPITSVLAIDGPRIQQLPVEDTASIACWTEPGARAMIDLSWSVDKRLDTYVSVYGTEGALRLGWAGSWWKSDTNPEWTAFGTGYRKIDAMRAEVLDFVGAVRDGRPTMITLDDALASVAVIEAAYRSMEAGCWEQVRTGTADTAGSASADVAAMTPSKA
jgi:predicted dehydrogenase